MAVLPAPSVAVKVDAGIVGSEKEWYSRESTCAPFSSLCPLQVEHSRRIGDPFPRYATAVAVNPILVPVSRRLVMAHSIGRDLYHQYQRMEGMVDVLLELMAT